MSESYLDQARRKAIEIATRKLRDEFRKWYAALSLKEIVTNKVLIAEIEVLEQLLSGQRATT